MPYAVTPQRETAAIQRTVDRFPEASAADIAQYVLEDLWTGDDPDDAELDHAYEHLRRRARDEWACPE